MGSKGQHLRSSRRGLRSWVIAVAMVVAGGGAVAGVALTRSGSHPTSAATVHDHAAPTASTVAPSQLVAELAAAVTISPANGTTNVAPDASVMVASGKGKIQAVQVVSSGGSAVMGTLAPGGRQWQSSGPLSVSSSYQVTVMVSGADGTSAQVPARFSTLTPTAKVTGSLFPGDATTVGVGQPVVVRFSRSVTTPAAQAGVLSHLTVTSSLPLTGGWHWFSPRELHFRPQTYWPAGDQVTVSSDLRGWDAGNGAWGSGQVNVRFAIGDSHIAVADLSTDVMTVTDNGRLIATYPFSGGRTQYPTMTGVHLALDKSRSVIMDSATVGIPKGSPGYYYETVYWDVRISDSGEYVHAAPWSTGSQGRSNVSHGCINLSTARAATFFGFSQVGDVIQVINGPRPPVAGDHGVMDWGLDWSQWSPAVVQTSAAAVTTPSTTGASATGASTTGPATTGPATTGGAASGASTTGPATAGLPATSEVASTRAAD